MTTTPLIRDNAFRPNSGSGATTQGEITYNGFTFPPGTKIEIKFSPEMDSNDRVRKWINAEIRVTGYIFNGVQTQGYPTSGTAYPDPLPTDSSAQYVKNVTWTTDTAMTYLRSRLTEPCQPLLIRHQGGGDIRIQYANGVKDINNGPKPKMVTWRPLTNKLAYVEWECKAAYVPCSTGAYISDNDVASFVYSFEKNIDKNGLSVRVVRGEIEIPMTRLPGANGYAGESTEFNTTNLENRIIRFFPRLPQFKRDQQFSMSEDRKIFRFSITDTEIDSDSSYGIGCVDENVTLTTSTGLEQGGFGNWDTTLSGTIRVAPGYTKQYAFAELSRIFNKIFVQSSTKGKKGGKVAGLNINLGEQTQPFPSQLIDSEVILKKLSYTDEIFGRTIGFDIQWMLFCNPEYIFKATNLFQPLEGTFTDLKKERDFWKAHRSSLNQFPGGYQGLYINNHDDMIVSMCQPWREQVFNEPVPKQEKQKPEKTEKPPNPAGDKNYPDAPDPYATYGNVDVQYYVEAVNHTLEHLPLGDIEAKIPTLTPGLLNTNTIFGVPASAANAARHIYHKLRDTTYILHFMGFAHRLHYTIPIPQVSHYLGSPVIKIGTDQIEHTQVAEGVSMNNGQVYSINRLVWHQRYALQEKPSNTIITSDGLPALYGTGPSRFA